MFAEREKNLPTHIAIQSESRNQRGQDTKITHMNTESTGMKLGLLHLSLLLNPLYAFLLL